MCYNKHAARDVRWESLPLFLGTLIIENFGAGRLRLGHPHAELCRIITRKKSLKRTGWRGGFNCSSFVPQKQTNAEVIFAISSRCPSGGEVVPLLFLKNNLPSPVLCPGAIPWGEVVPHCFVHGNKSKPMLPTANN